MNCPGCRRSMRELVAGAALGNTTAVSVCAACRAFWFEPFQTAQLSQASTLMLFGLIAEHSSRATGAPFPTRCHCPVCGSRLLSTHDRQRNTRFEYLRCDHGHGRFTRFTDFLKEKDFIRPLSPRQLAELRQNVQMIHCTGCGAPVDLAGRSVCEHCGAAVSMLDLRKLVNVADEVDRMSAEPVSVPRPKIVQTRRPIPALVSAGRKDGADEPADGMDLLQTALQAVADWLREITQAPPGRS